ncbi:hypothetical protein ACUN8C_06175 [Kushneria sp. Sum13]|uniref:hypothetical protein n=1 Tax=Kushneria sp. Sum13 TaxID=3459196 RepID=UPI0040462BF0
MDIKLKTPVQFSASTVEFDERLPSVKFEINLLVEKFCYSISVNIVCWVECAVFDSFINALRLGGDALIKDMSDEFSIAINSEKNRLIWSCSKIDAYGNLARASGEEVLSEDDKSRITSAFENYPRWWL